ncbi:MAG: LuxR C-terminal-related transcriptional regulator [Coriobacteriia bacterium]|nr:LuxR C-terminal-related transcriptional regulator [Coriobacteriia bacterium]MCL2749977.1 LuxR C-terminal-related transcriptional regulator [Coriobacteriia bacterium]
MGQKTRQGITAGKSYRLQRSRLNSLFKGAVDKHSLIIVTAGVGYGKTFAVQDFVESYNATTSWMQLSVRDNVSVRFWENFTHTIKQNNQLLATVLSELGFPDTPDKLNRYAVALDTFLVEEKGILVIDDLHLIEDPSVLQFISYLASHTPHSWTLIIVSRTTPNISLAKQYTQGQVCNFSEDELRFTENEIVKFFRQLSISLPPGSLQDIFMDTEGWAFAINIIARSYQKTSKYGGYAKDAVRATVFEYMETEIWSGLSEELKTFLVKLSLIDHLSINLIELLAKGNQEDTLYSLEQQSAYVRRDTYMNAYLIHQMFLDFLSQKQDILTEEQKRETYKIAGDWCSSNGFKIDAMTYYEKIGDYDEIISIFTNQIPLQVPEDIGEFAVGIFERAPKETYDTVELFATEYIRVVLSLGRWFEAIDLLMQYEEKYLQFPESGFRDRLLGGIYYAWGIMRRLTSTIDDTHDAHIYYEKMALYWGNKVMPYFPTYVNHPNGPWISVAGSSREGSLQEFYDSLVKTTQSLTDCFYGALSGSDDLALGEIKFYQGDIEGAEILFKRAFVRAREYNLYDNLHRATFFMLRVAIHQGNFDKCEQALEDMKPILQQGEYQNRFIVYNIAVALYYFFLRMPEEFPDWLKKECQPYKHFYFIENFENQMKLRYAYLTGEYARILEYNAEMRERESVLYGRVELLTMEACAHLKLKNREAALATLKEAYDEAAPNRIVLPFIELGKDMRTLVTSALREKDCGIPRAWLEDINRKSASFAKRQAHIISQYRKAHNIEEEIILSPREREVLTDLYHGLSRSEIAASRKLSASMVKALCNAVYEKLGAETLADVIRISVEEKLV